MRTDTCLPTGWGFDVGVLIGENAAGGVLRRLATSLGWMYLAQPDDLVEFENLSGKVVHINFQ